MSTAIDPALVAQFTQALERLNPQGGRIGLAVSGGPDSMALLLLAHAAIPGQFEVATIDHGLRREAREECALVERVCAERSAPCSVLRLEVGAGNVQARARQARYDALGRWAAQRGLARVATAHHADDQAETLIMRLNRASGIDGLTGIREAISMPYADQEADKRFIVIRPLLALRQKQLAQLPVLAGVAVAHDPSNENERYDRVRLRKALRDADWIAPAAWSASASYLGDAQEALEFAYAQFWEDTVRYVQGAAQSDIYLDVSRPAPRYFLHRAVHQTISRIGGNPRGSDVAHLVRQLQSGKPANLAGVLASVAGQEWHFRKEPARRTR